MERDGFGERLQKAMDDKGMTQADLVRACERIAPSVKINRSDISRYLAGKILPRADKLVVISKALGVPYNLLAGQSSGKGLPPEISLALKCLCDPSRCPGIYTWAVPRSDIYNVYVSRPPDGDIGVAMSFFAAAGEVLEDGADSAELAARIMRAIKANGVEREILERLFPAHADDEVGPKGARKGRYFVSDYPATDGPKDRQEDLSDRVQQARSKIPNVVIRKRQK